MGWNLSFWDGLFFRGQTVGFRECKVWKAWGFPSWNCPISSTIMGPLSVVSGYISLVTPTDNWGSVAHGRIWSDHLPRFVFCEGIDASGRILQSFLVIVIYTVDIPDDFIVDIRSRSSKCNINVPQSLKTLGIQSLTETENGNQWAR